MPFADFQGRPLFYFEHRRSPDGGTGAPAVSLPLLLVHGAGGTHLHWPPEVRRLAGVDIFALDLPGHGQSPAPSEDEGADAGEGTVPAQAAAVLGLLDHLGQGQAVIAGHSMGGAVALWLALEHPERVAGLALVATGARLRVAPELLERVGTDFAGAVDRVHEWLFGPSAGEALRRLSRQRMLENGPRALLADWQACDSFDVRERLEEVRAPALVLCGDADRMTPEKFSRFLAERIPGAELHLLPGAGHMLMLEQPREVARRLADFLARLRPVRSGPL